MKKIITTVFSLCLILCLCFSFVGCTDDSNPSNFPNEPNQSEDETEDSGQNTEGEFAMTLEINGKIYNVVLDDNSTARDIVAKLPLELTINRYANHEHYASLPFTPTNDAPKTSHILAGHIYYWDGWNAFVINYIDWDIPPYQVVHIGEITDKSIIDVLENNESVVVKVDK